MSASDSLTDPNHKSPSRPKYQQIFDRLYAEIRSGRWAEGEPLPTEAKLTESLGMARNTIRQALAQLEDNGFIQRIRGRGTFVTTAQQRQARKQLDVFALIAPTLQSGSYPALLHGFEQACSDHRHQTVVGNSGDQVGKQADLIIQMVTQNIGGVAIVPTTAPATPAHQIRLLQDNRIPVVLCHRLVPGVSAPSVLFSGQEIGLHAGRKLVQLGHRRVAFFFSHLYSMSEGYGQGLREAFAEQGLDPQGVEFVEYGPNVGMPDPKTEGAISSVLTKLLARADRPTAIFVGNAPAAELIYLHAESAGFKVPRDLSLMHVGAIQRQQGLAARLSGVAIDEREMGACAVRLLHEMRTGLREIDNDEQFKFPVSVLAGETLGPAPQEQSAANSRN